jgi:Domain of unknown function (DUF6438)
MRGALRSILLAASLAGCHGSTPASTPAPTDTAARDDATQVVSLERTPCFGSCPVYRVTISRGGMVHFEGTRFVAHVGADSAQIAKPAVDSLLAELDRGGFYDLEKQYVAGVSGCGLYATDLPGAITSVDDGSRSKRVQHDRGCSDAPQALATLEDRIDEVAGTARWTGR